MCGIGGILGNGISDLDHLVEDIFMGLETRGPDAFHIKYIHDYGYLAHARLSILDNNARSNQPMSSKCGRYVLVYNGEIYNFRELSNWMAGKGHFLDYSNSDSRVLIEGFAHFGISFISRLRGMFAACIYDVQEKMTYLFRDTYGIKPLYYSVVDTTKLVFGSRTCVVKRALAAIGDPCNRISDASLVEAFMFRGPITNFYENIFEIKPGTVLVFDACGNINSITIEQPPLASSNDIVTTLSNSMIKHLVADAPVAVMLSGGVDSTILSQFGSELGLKCGYTYKQTTHLDESAFAQQVARECEIELRNVSLDNEDLKGWLSYIDIPITDPSAVPIYSIAKAAYNDGYKVLLSGEGADEIFGGYKKYKAALLVNTGIRLGFKKIILKLLRSVVFRGLHVIKNKIYFTGSSSPISVPDLKKIFNEDIDIDRIIEKSSLELCGAQEFHKELSKFEISNRLANDLLKRSDMATMAGSIECRVPFVDKEVISFASDLNFASKFSWHGLSTKKALRLSLRRKLRSIVNRPKTGFDLDLKNWIASLYSDFEKFIEDKQINIFDYGHLEQLLKNYKHLSSSDLYVLWSWLIVETSIRNR